MSFTVTPSNDKILWARALLGHNTKEELARGHFFEGLQNYLEKKNERNESKIILRDLFVLWIKWTGIVAIQIM